MAQIFHGLKLKNASSTIFDILTSCNVASMNSHESDNYHPNRYKSIKTDSPIWFDSPDNPKTPLFSSRISVADSIVPNCASHSNCVKTFGIRSQPTWNLQKLHCF